MVVFVRAEVLFSSSLAPCCEQLFPQRFWSGEFANSIRPYQDLGRGTRQDDHRGGPRSHYRRLTAHPRKRRLISSSCEAPGEELDRGEVDHGGSRDEGCLEIFGQSVVAAEPSERPLNGLITNDKFCLTRTGRLRLSWPRARVGLRVPASLQPPGGVTHQGGEHAAAATHLARPAQWRAGGNRPAALGSGLPASPAVGGHGPACVGRGAGAPDPAGDIPCA